MKMEKIKELYWTIYRSVKYFNFTKYLLNKKERKLQTSIMLKEGLIEHWKQDILFYENSVLVNNSLILQTEKEIKELEKDVKKVVKVINLYID